MAQLFHPSMNTIAKVVICATVLVLGFLPVLGWLIEGSPYVTFQGVVRDQPVPFSHEHHVRELGIDCRYCHTSVTDSSFAGLPATKTCMTCHSRVWTDAPVLQAVRTSWRDEIPLKWTRVHNLPDFVYFPHDIHVNKGIGCTTCHGLVDQMPLMFQHADLRMGWCLYCHRNPEKFLRPREEVFNMDYALTADVKARFSTKDHPVTDQDSLGRALIDLYHIPTDGRITNCFTCHR